MLSNRLIALLEQAVCRYVCLDPVAAKRMGDLADKTIQLELTGWGNLYVTPHAGGIHLKHHYAGNPQATITGSPLLLMRIALTHDQQLTQQLQVQGDIHLAQAFSQILQQLDIDWEEHLSHMTGDIVAHQIGNAARGLRKWRQQFSQQLQSNFTQYLQEESRHLPPREELEDFFADIITLRQDVERLEANLQQKISSETE